MNNGRVKKVANSTLRGVSMGHFQLFIFYAPNDLKINFRHQHIPLLGDKNLHTSLKFFHVYWAFQGGNYIFLKHRSKNCQVSDLTFFWVHY